MIGVRDSKGISKLTKIQLFLPKDGEKDSSDFLPQTLTFDNVSDLFVLHRVIMVKHGL